MSFRDERGQAMALSVICLTVLLTLSALVLDVGSWYQAQRETQAAADAAALAAAQALPESQSEAGVLAASYVAKNGGGTAAVTFSTRAMASDTVTVTVERDTPGFFARIFGVDSVTVDGRASARSGVPSSARYAAPIAVDEKHPLLSGGSCPCFNEPTELDLQKVGPGAFRLINLDGSFGGTGGTVSAGWVLHGYDGYMKLGDYYSDAGAAYNDNKFKDALTTRIGDELLFPIYRSVKGGGSNLEYEIVGWAGFVVTSFSGNGNKGKVHGSFVRVIWEGILSEGGTDDDFGVRAVELVE